MTLQLQTYELEGHRLQLYVPDPKVVQALYKEQKKLTSTTPFPYWAQLWPAALAMGKFLLQHPQHIQGKQVLELGAGLGLPSFIAAPIAKSVCCSDYLPEAVAVMQQTIAYNKFENVQCEVLDWKYLPATLTTDVLMLSDVNYDPSEFEILYTVLLSFLKKGNTILLSTPQRLMAKQFIERLLPFCINQQEIIVSYGEQDIMTSILVLR